MGSTAPPSTRSGHFCMLMRLPLDILQLVFARLHKPDLKSLSLTSKPMHTFIARILWRSIMIKPWSEYHLHKIPDAFPSPNFARLATNVRFHTNMQYATLSRCPHLKDDANVWDSDEGDFDSDGDVELEPRFKQLSQRAKLLLDEFMDGQLRGFSWDLGTCVPPEILDTNGILPRKHHRIRSLSLTTDYACSQHEYFHDHCNIDLASFRNLRDLCWKGPRPEDLDTLAIAIRTNSQHLQSLQLDFVDWQELRENLGYIGDEEDENGIAAPDIFVYGILGLSDRSPRPILPAIRTLDLSHVPVSAAMVRVLNFNSLQSLTLRMCPGMDQFLKRILQSKLRIRLERLEIKEAEGRGSALGHVPDYLDAFEGLTELCLGQTGSAAALDLLKRIRRRHATLRRLVLHHRTCAMVRNFEEACDLPDMGISKFELSQMRKEPALNPFSKLDLEFLGLSCVPELLQHLLVPFGSKATLKILHVRQSASDLRHYASWAMKPTERSSIGYPNSELGFRDKFYQFLKWVFGPDGISSLQIVLFGDFAYGGRIAQKNVLLCRDPGSNNHFRVTNAVDAEWIEVRNGYRSAIEACPTEPILGETCGMA